MTELEMGVFADKLAQYFKGYPKEIKCVYIRGDELRRARAAEIEFIKDYELVGWYSAGFSSEHLFDDIKQCLAETERRKTERGRLLAESVGMAY